MSENRTQYGGGRERAAGSAGWLPLADLVGLAPVGERQLRRHCQRLRPLGQARKVDGRWLIAAVADIRDRAVLSWLTEGEPDGRPRRRRRLPAELGRRPWDEQRHRDTLTLLDRVDKYMAAHVGEPAAKRWAGVRQQFGQWAWRRRLSVRPGTLRVYRDRTSDASPRFDGNLDRRGCASNPRRRSRVARVQSSTNRRTRKGVSK